MKTHPIAQLRWSRVVLPAVAGVLVAACAGSSPAEVNVPTASDGPVEGTLTFYTVQSTGTEGPWLEQLGADFEEKYPNADVEITQFSTQDYWVKLLASFSSGDEPDVFISLAGEDLNKYVRVGRVAPLDKLVDFSYFNQAAVDEFRWTDGHIYSVPRSSYVLTGWANKDILSQHGLDVPTSWDDLLGVCRELSSAGVTPMAIGNAGQDRFPTSHLMDALVYQLAGPGAVIDATYGTDGANWTDEAYVDAATRMKELVDTGCFPEGFTGMSYTQMTNMFAQGQAGMVFTGSWFADILATSDVKFKTQVFPWPDVPGASHSTSQKEGIVGGVGGIAASAKAAEENPELVAAFLNEFGKRVDDYANSTSDLSVAAEPHLKGSPQQAALTDLLATVDELAPVGNVILPKVIADAYEGDIVTLTAGELTPEEWAEDLADTAEREQSNLPDLD